MSTSNLAAVYRFRGFVIGSVKREFLQRYTHSAFGAAWSLLAPLAMIVVYTVIFSEVMRARLAEDPGPWSYSIYLCAGLIPWAFFSELVTRGQGLFVEQAGLIKKLAFPRTCLPVIAAASSVLNFVMPALMLMAFLVLVDKWPGVVVLTALLPLAIQSALALGLGMSLGVLHVFYRDIGHALSIALQFWFWLTPIVYPRSILPAWLQPIVDWNPVAPIVKAYQTVLLENRAPDLASLAYPALIASALCVTAGMLFHRHAAEIVDEL